MAAEQDWAEREPGHTEAVHELTRVLRRARGRPIITLLLATMCASALVVKQARKVPIYSAKVVLRMSEDANTTARRSTFFFKEDLREYVWTVVLSNEVLFDIMDEHDLFTAELELGPEWALEAFRDAARVDVFHNYFVIDPGSDDEARSVRIAMVFSSLEPDLSVAVAEEMAQRFLDHERRARWAALDTLRAQASQQLHQAEEELNRRTAERAELWARMEATTDDMERTRIQVELDTVRDEIEAYTLILEQARRDRTAVELAESGALAVEIAQTIRPQRILKSKKTLAVLGLLGFCFALPLCAIFVGAFDARVYDTEDVERLGLATVGHVPRFPGDRTGALRDRLKKVSARRRGSSRSAS